MSTRKTQFAASLSHLVLSSLLLLLLGTGSAGAQVRTVLVSPVPGDPVASGTALRNALAGIPSPSATNRWLLKIEPGIYDIGATSLQLRSWVDVEGSGIGATTIRGSVPAQGVDAAIHGASNMELRLLSIEALSNASAPDIIAMANYDASPKLYRVKFTSVGNIVWGLRNVNGIPRIEECEINVTSTSTAGTEAYGVVLRGFPPGGRSSMLRTSITVSGAGINYGVYLADSLVLSDIVDSKINVQGGNTTRGVYSTSIPGWSGNEPLRIRNSEVVAGGGASASYGVDLSTTIYLEMVGSKIWGHLSPTTFGIRQTAPATATVMQHSSIVGFTGTVSAAGNASIASTMLNGGPVTAGGWLGCMGVWDENGVFFANSCPP